MDTDCWGTLDLIDQFVLLHHALTREVWSQTGREIRDLIQNEKDGWNKLWVCKQQRIGWEHDLNESSINVSSEQGENSINEA